MNKIRSENRLTKFLKSLDYNFGIQFEPYSIDLLLFYSATISLNWTGRSNVNGLNYKRLLSNMKVWEYCIALDVFEVQ